LHIAETIWTVQCRVDEFFESIKVAWIEPSGDRNVEIREEIGNVGEDAMPTLLRSEMSLKESLKKRGSLPP
jgi:hypothetical protein